LPTILFSFWYHPTGGVTRGGLPPAPPSVVDTLL